jgi:biotin carboxyl carrier protein
MKINQKHLLFSGFALLVSGAIPAWMINKTESQATPAIAAKPSLIVNTVNPDRTAWPVELTANGDIAAWQEAVVAAEVGGLRLNAVKVNLGDSVRKGQLLAQFSKAKQPSGQLPADYTQVLAPDDGIISSRTATLGSVVGMGQELFRLISKNRLEWRAQVAAADLAKIKVADEVRVNLPNRQQIKGAVRMIAPTLDPRTRIALVYVDIDSVPEAKAGMFASGEFLLGTTQALSVPHQAVVVRDGFSYVFAVAKDQRVKQVRVQAGRYREQRIEILQGLPEDAAIVVNGAGFLNDGDLVSVQAEAVNNSTPK